MSKKIDPRLPQGFGKGCYEDYPAIRSPWEKLIGYKEALYFSSRHYAAISAAVMQAVRILLPDYEERASLMCDHAKSVRIQECTSSKEYANMDLNIHPFFRGNFVGALNGDAGDEMIRMCGRVNDFGTYRAEKELDVCDWDIVGSEVCRATTASLQGIADGMASHLRKGPMLEYCMVEAKGCGDRHCRIVAECREKYPMPEHASWETFGPIATADQIKFTPEEDCVEDTMYFREECGYRFANGTNTEREYPMTMAASAASGGGIAFFVLDAMTPLIAEGRFEEKQFRHVLKCVAEAAGKASFIHDFAKRGLRDWMGVPINVGDDDGRLMGGLLELGFQARGLAYETEAFNKEEMIYILDRGALSFGNEYYLHSQLAFWYGMTKSLVNAQWALWEENSPEGKVRIKIARKIDKFC